ncbi:MAG: SUMF1/EgtB/PvdO family nonheme iron enzyme [Treponema sp.]|nr:SUMF1/EgtB/PvdO family nonheme iron enzyme [Treponema sp.]
MKKLIPLLFTAFISFSLFAQTTVGENKIIEIEGKRILDSFVKLPGKKLRILKTEVTNKLYQDVMGENPSGNEGEDYPVEHVSWYDAIYFCNKLSKKLGVTPVYVVDGKTDVATWNYTPHNDDSILGKVTQNTKANGFRLPTVEEWQYAARGGQNYEYSGSNNLDEVGWYNNDNSGVGTHPVAKKKANGYGLYDMSGNVMEWCWDSTYGICRYYCGGSYYYGGFDSEVGNRDYCHAYNSGRLLGFRIVCNAD